MTAIAPANLTAKTNLFTNPMRLDGFEFVELASSKQDILKPIFKMLGLSKIAHHRSKNITLFRHGDINFITNHEPTSHAAFVAEENGPSACGLAFRVKGSQHAYNMALDLGVQPISISTRPIELNLLAIKGTGVTPIYLIDCCQDEQSFYDIDFECIGNAPRHQNRSNYTTIDYMTHNDHRGRIGYCGNYYEKLFGFRKIRHFDIKERYTRLKSRTLTAPDGQIRIPLNEEASEGAGRIKEFFIV